MPKLWLGEITTDESLAAKLAGLAAFVIKSGADSIHRPGPRLELFDTVGLKKTFDTDIYQGGAAGPDRVVTLVGLHDVAVLVDGASNTFYVH